MPVHVERSRRAEAIRFLVRERWTRLLGAARAAGPDAEDAVQDVLERLAAGAGAPPADPERLTAYAAVAVRRRAVELAGRRRAAPAVDRADPVDETDAATAAEARRLLGAYARALGDLPEAARAAVVLDAAGWPRRHVAGACGLSERTVKRLLATHRAPVLAATARALDGTDCARLAETLEACGDGRWRPRRDGPLTAHLAVCPACAAALARARATRAALRALFPAPTGLAPPFPAAEAASVPLVAGALKAPWLVGLAVSAAVTAGTAGDVASKVTRTDGRGTPQAARPPAAETSGRTSAAAADRTAGTERRTPTGSVVQSRRPAASPTDRAARVAAAVVAATRAPAVPTPLQATATPARPRLADRTVRTVPLHTSSALGGAAGEPSVVAPVAAAPSRVRPGTVPDALRGTGVRPVTATPDDGCRATGLC